MFIDSAKFNCGSSGVECCYRRHTSRSAGARPESIAAAINIWSLRDQAYSSHTLLPDYPQVKMLSELFRNALCLNHLEKPSELKFLISR